MQTQSFQTQKSIWKTLGVYLIMTVGLCLYVTSWTIFLIPNHIVGGGVVGLSSIVYLISNEAIPVGVTNFAINGILFCFGFYFLGKKFAINNIFGILMTSLLFLLVQQWIGLQNFPSLHKLALKNLGGLDPFVCALIGGVMSGIGVGIVLSNGGNSGGSDVIALILNKYYNVSLGNVIMVADALVIIGSISIPGNDITQIVYGFIVLVAYTFTIDYVVDGKRQTYKILIFSKKNEQIADIIGKKLKRGVTFVNGTGWYTKKDVKILMVVVHRRDKVQLMQFIKSLDPEAFMTVEKTESVFGLNFDKIKK